MAKKLVSVSVGRELTQVGLDHQTLDVMSRRIVVYTHYSLIKPCGLNFPSVWGGGKRRGKANKLVYIMPNLACSR